MAQSNTEVANAALLKIGAKPSATILADSTPEGEVCLARLEICKRAVLRMHPWNFAIKRASLSPTFVTITGAADNGSTLVRITATSHGAVTGDRVTIIELSGVTGNGTWTVTRIDANTIDLQDSVFGGTYTSGGQVTIAPQFDYEYRVLQPTDCLRCLRVNDLISGYDWRVEGRYIISRDYPVELKYIYDVTDYTTMDIGFYEALSTYLAWDISYRITKSSVLKQALRDEFRELAGKARFVDSTEDGLEMLGADDWVNSRGGAAPYSTGSWV